MVGIMIALFPFIVIVCTIFTLILKRNYAINLYKCIYVFLKYLNCLNAIYFKFVFYCSIKENQQFVCYASTVNSLWLVLCSLFLNFFGVRTSTECLLFNPLLFLNLVVLVLKVKIL